MPPVTHTIATCAVITLCGCAAHRDLPTEEKVSIADVLDQVECELHAAVATFVAAHSDQPHYRKEFVNGWAAAASLTLETTDEANLNGGFLYGNPLTGGILRLTFNASASEKVHRIADLTVSFTLKDLYEKGCQTRPGPEGRRGRYFSNDTGVSEWFHRASTSLHQAGNFPPDKFSHSLDFTITKAGDGKGAWTFIHSGPSVGGKLSVQDMYQLKVAFSPIPSPQRVRVVNFGELGQLLDAPPAEPRRPQAKFGTQQVPFAKTKSRRLPPAPPEARHLLDQQLFQLDLRSVLPNR